MTAGKAPLRRRLYRYDGDQPVRCSYAQATAWASRVREALREFDAAVRADDLESAVDWAHEVSGSGAEIESIAEATREVDAASSVVAAPARISDPADERLAERAVMS